MTEAEAKRLQRGEYYAKIGEYYAKIKGEVGE